MASPWRRVRVRMRRPNCSGRGGAGGVFGDDEGLGGEEVGGAGAAEEIEGGGVFDGGVVGRVEEDEVEGEVGVRREDDTRGRRGDGGAGEAVEGGGGAALFDGDAADDAERGEVGAEGAEGDGAALGEEDVGGAAAEGLDADGAGAAVEVGEAGVGDAGREDVEEGLAEAIAGGPGGVAGRGRRGAANGRCPR